MARGRWAALLAFTLIVVAAPAPAGAAATVRVGTYPNPPLIFREGGGPPQGMYVDVLESIAELEGWKLQYVEGTWEECLERLQHGKIDLLVAIGYSPERSRIYDFSREPFIVNWGQVYVRDSNIKTLLDLTGRKLAVVRGDVYYHALRAAGPDLKIFPTFVEVSGYADTLRLVSDKEADAALVPRIFGAYQERSSTLEKTSIMFSPVELRFAAPQGTGKQILAALDRHLAAMKADKRSMYYRSLGVWLEGVRTLVFPKWLNPFWVVGAVAFVGTVIVTANVILRRKVRQRTRELTASLAVQAKITSELRIAREIQMTFVPHTYPALPGWQIHGELRPAREVGGDFYDCFLLDDGRLYFVLGDVSDKGVPAALFMAVTKTLLGASAATCDSPAAVMDRVNSRTAPDNDKCMFVTAFCGILEPDTGRIIYANAGHNPPMAVRASGGVDLLEYAKDPPLGFQDEPGYGVYEIVLAPGDALFMYTDGVTDATNETGAFFSDDRLRTAVAGGGPRSAEALATTVLAAVSAFVGTTPQYDDIAMLVLHRDGNSGIRQFANEPASR